MPRNRFVPLLAAALAACAARQPAAFRLAGEAGTLAQLAGQWSGSYESPMLGRSGSVIFTFPDTGTTARGDVVMVLPGQSTPVTPANRQSMPSTGQPATPAAPVLAIEFAQARGDSITGTVSPYLDPDCGCNVQATFTGRIEGDVIRGTFVTTRSIGGERVHGTWQVRRRGT